MECYNTAFRMVILQLYTPIYQKRDTEQMCQAQEHILYDTIYIKFLI